MRRHVVDGAEILRRTPEMPALAPVVAFEHHLRLDASGYPFGVKRGRSLNLGTMLCSIADVYDAMRSQRAYQQAFPTDRILAVLKRADGRQFDQHLVRRFVQLLGVYPPGTLVQLRSGPVAVVLKVHAPDPHRPLVRILRSAEGTPSTRSSSGVCGITPADGESADSIRRRSIRRRSESIPLEYVPTGAAQQTPAIPAHPWHSTLGRPRA